MKVVFLDIDGVLNSPKNYMAYAEAQKKEPDLNPELRGRIDRMHRHVEHLFDKDNIAALNEITDMSGAQIVVSSSWRRFYHGRDGNPGLKDLADLLHRVGVKAPIFDKTPDHLTTKLSQHTSRGTEIQAWLDVYTSIWSVDSFVILDDDDDMEHLKPKHVLTNGVKGLTPEDVVKALKILQDR